MIDLFDECGEDLLQSGYKTEELEKYGVTHSFLRVAGKSEAKKMGFTEGDYHIFCTPKLDFLMREHEKFLSEKVEAVIGNLFQKSKIGKRSKILFVGIGNPEILADTFGVRCVQKIEIMPYSKKNRIFKIIPNTFSNTGINPCDAIRLFVEWCKIDLVVIFDSLCTQSISRLGCSLQINNAGLTPGSAMNNFGIPLNRGTLCTPCISIGVPTMIFSKSLGQKKNVVLTEKDARQKIEFWSNLVSKVALRLF